MAEKKEKVPEHIAKFNRMSTDADQVGDRMELHHSEAFNAAVRRNLLNKKGNPDYKLLKNDDKQIAMANDIAQYHITEAQKYFKSKLAKGDEMERQLLMNAYAGATQGELRMLFNKNKDNLNLNNYNNLKTKLINPIRDKMMSVASAHLKTSHIDDIVKYTKSGDVVNKDALGVKEGVTLLGMYKDGEGITSDNLLKKEFEDHQLLEYSKKKKK
jgi:hypothetical protein